MRVTAALFLAACLACPANAQSPRELLGKIVKGDDQSQTPVANIEVTLEEPGSHDISTHDGLFHVFLPDVFTAGVEVTISVTVPGYAIYDPPGGKFRIPADLKRTRQKIQLLPTGSPEFLSHARLQALVEQTAKESNRQSAQPRSKDPPDLGRYLRDWAVQYGFSVDQVRAELDRWATDVATSRASSYELALAAFEKRNFSEASERALDDATEAEANLRDLQKQQQESIDRAIQAYRLSGDAFYNGLDFEKASSAYGKALSYATRERNATEWADLQVRFGNAENELSLRSVGRPIRQQAEGAAIRQHAESALSAYSLALEVYTRETLPQAWARTQNNRGDALDNLAKGSEEAQARTYLEQAMAAYHSALEVRTRERFPRDWARTQNSLGDALTDLARQSEGAQASRAYLEQAVATYRGALEVSTREHSPRDWASTQDRLCMALHDLAWRVERPQSGAYLEQAVTACRSALQVYTREQLPEDWATTQNNLGIALADLARRSEQAQARAYLEQALSAFRNALQVTTEADSPVAWRLTTFNLAQAYELQGDWNNARQTYEQILRQEPGNAGLQAKIQQLAKKQ